MKMLMRGQVQNGLFTKLQLMHYDTLSEGVVVLPDGRAGGEARHAEQR